MTVRGGIWHEGALAGNGFVGQGATIRRNASVSPGLGTNSPGTLTISNGLALVDGGVDDGLLLGLGGQGVARLQQALDDLVDHAARP